MEGFCCICNGKKCMEIGIGLVGVVTRWWWVDDRIIIDPLLDIFRAAQLKLFGETFFTDDLERYSQIGEIFIDKLEGKIDGAIVCLNTIDHAEKPLIIVDNIARYAAPGCKLLFWSTLYYPHGHNEGHHNVMETAEQFEKFLEDLGFRIDYRVPPELQLLENNQVGYGCMATRV